MAEAEKQIRSRVIETPYITLELTMAEARTLLAISCRISGSHDTSPRMHTDAIGMALSGALRVDYDQVVEHGLLNDTHRYSSIDFKDYGAEHH